MAKEIYSYEKHQFVFSKAIGKQYCVKCGLVALNNDYSKWAIDKGCLNSLHTSVKAIQSKYTNIFNFAHK